MSIRTIRNSRITNVADVETYDIIPGRALMVVLSWHGILRHVVLNTYAPATNAADRRRFWKDLLQKMVDRNLPAPDTHLGDHNMVEDGVDRLPHKTPSKSAVKALQDLRSTYRLVDGWREINPDTKAYTHEYSQGGRARLDRIYVTPDVLKQSHSWMIESVGSLTDHDLISYVMTSQQIPFIGRGRWAIPLYLMNNNALLERIRTRGKTLEHEMDRKANGDDRLPSHQGLWQTFKEDVSKMAKDTAKVAIPKLDREIGEWTVRLKTVENDNSLSSDEKR
ncbi:hypothetical protein BD626DRAFT_396799, partial [Schizophyllum amplum]